MKKNSEWSKLFEPFSVVNASSDMVCSKTIEGLEKFINVHYREMCTMEGRTNRGAGVISSYGIIAYEDDKIT